MKIFENAISDELNQKCIEFIQKKISNRDFYYSSASTLRWYTDLIEVIIGSCHIMPTPANLGDEILESIGKIFPENDRKNDIAIQFYIWDRLSGINWHDDWVYDYGMTIYLNEYWNENWGGIFLWQDKTDNNQIKGLMPKKNTMVINNNHEVHCVTPIGVLYDMPRMTIQIFVKKTP